ncbi:MAG: c-type cytochrome [Proteobacteria bacterium]|nr:c-type cytochrome [Pseudomonadota bacterium]
MRCIASLVLALSFMTVGPVFAQVGATAGADSAATGKALFEQRCTACHTIGGGVRVGPDLAGVTQRVSEDWMVRFIMEPDKVIASKDPTAMALVKQFNQIQMPNLGVTQDEARAIIAHLRSAAATAPAEPAPAPVAMSQPPLASPQAGILELFLIITVVIAAVFVWVGFSTRTPHDVDVKRAYGLRRVFFIGSVVAVVALLVATIPMAPYAKSTASADRIVYVAARQFDFVFSDEPITAPADLSQVRRIDQLEIPAGSMVEFRVTSLDVNHGFGLYGPQRQIIAQTQAMPGYFNRLRVRLTEPAQYKVLCLEYCASGHHLMQTHLTVK